LADPIRVATVRGTGLLGTPPEAAFDRLARLASKVLHARVGMVSLLDDCHLHVKSLVGLPGQGGGGRLPVEESFCQHVVITGRALLVDDARENELTRDLALVRAGVARSYAGVPLVLPGRQVAGALSVADSEPRAWQPEQVEILEDLAASVQTEIELRAMQRPRRRPKRAPAAGQDAELARYLAGVFREDSRRGLKQVADALRQKDAPAVARAAGELKGSSGQVGAAHTQAISAELQAVAETGELGSARALLRRLEAAVDATQSALSSAVPENAQK